MPDIDYLFKAVRRKYVNYAQKRSVLWPLVGRKSLYKEAVLEDCAKLLKWWRIKVRALYDVGWPDLNKVGKVQFVRNCPPNIAVALSQQIARPCKLSAICPWCYAREVEVLYNKLAAFLPSNNSLKNNPMRLVEVSNTRITSEKEIGTELDPHVQNCRRATKRIIRQLHAEGAYYTIQLEPVGKKKNKKWRLGYKMLAIVPTDIEIPEELYTNRKIRDSLVHNKKELIPVISRVCRYPVGLMRAEPERVVMALNARHGVRCKAMLGCLRNKREKDEEHPGEDF